MGSSPAVAAAQQTARLVREFLQRLSLHSLDLPHLFAQIRSLRLSLEQTGSSLLHHPPPVHEAPASLREYSQSLLLLRDALEHLTADLRRHRASLEGELARLHQMQRWAAASRNATLTPASGAGLRQWSG